MTKRRYKRKSIPIRIGEIAPKERQQHRGGLISEVADRLPNGKAVIKRMRAVAECVLDSYVIREVISPREYKAGIGFRKAYLCAILRIKTEDTGSGNHGDLEQAALMPTVSEQLLRQAYKVLDMTESTVIIDVCGYDSWAGGPYRLKALHSGLEKLANLWNIS